MWRSLHRQSTRWLLLLALGELLCLGVALNMATWLRFGSINALGHLPERSLMFAGMIMLGLAAMGQYQLHMRTTWFGLLARQAIGFLLGALGLAVAFYVVPQTFVGRGVLGIALVLGFLAVTAFRAAFIRLVEVEAFKRRILVLGAGVRASQVHSRLRRQSDRRGFVVVGFVARDGEPVEVPADRLLSLDSPLDAWAEAQHIDEIIVGVDDRRGNLLMEELLQCRQLGIAVTDLTTFFERESGRVQLSLTHPSWLVYSGGFDSTPMRKLTKRGFDLAAAVLVLALTWPLMLLTALAIRIESGAGQPVLYRQERVGVRGKTFQLIKFRSMRTDAERDGIARWAAKHDNRVTRVGRFIRKVRLDELPQLWNVLKGEMSFIGPRPERPQFVANLTKKIDYYSLRHTLKPGLAGWA
ncbi:MAG: TIGR03013 family PEP-CTERM/XrtA system glycosyltransferase, partial [Rhodanobacter sp.]